MTCRHAIVAGEAQLPGFTVAGCVREGAPFNPTWDHDWGEIVFIGNEELNVFFVDASVLSDAWGVKISASAGQTVIVNVNGSDAEITYMSWCLSGPIDRSAVLVNFHEATRLEITGIEVLGSILAPSAAVSFPAGLVQGGRQANYGYFVEPDTPPTPARVKMSTGFSFRLNLVKSGAFLCLDRGSDTRSCVLVQLRDASWSNPALLDRSSERPEGVTRPHESARTLSRGRPGGTLAAGAASTDRDPTVLHQLCAVLLHCQHKTWGAMKAAFRPAQGYPETWLFRSPGLRSVGRCRAPGRAGSSRQGPKRCAGRVEAAAARTPAPPLTKMDPFVLSRTDPV